MLPIRPPEPEHCEAAVLILARMDSHPEEFIDITESGALAMRHTGAPLKCHRWNDHLERLYKVVPTATVDAIENKRKVLTADALAKAIMAEMLRDPETADAGAQAFAWGTATLAHTGSYPIAVGHGAPLTITSGSNNGITITDATGTATLTAADVRAMQQKTQDLQRQAELQKYRSYLQNATNLNTLQSSYTTLLGTNTP